jgi:hypothetical protein
LIASTVMMTMNYPTVVILWNNTIIRVVDKKKCMFSAF